MYALKDLYTFDDSHVTKLVLKTGDQVVVDVRRLAATAHCLGHVTTPTQTSNNILTLLATVVETPAQAHRRSTFKYSTFHRNTRKARNQTKQQSTSVMARYPSWKKQISCRQYDRHARKRPCWNLGFITLLMVNSPHSSQALPKRSILSAHIPLADLARLGHLPLIDLWQLPLIGAPPTPPN